MSYKYEVSKTYTYKSNYKYRARVGIDVITNSATKYVVKWKIEVQAQHGYLYGMAVTGSGECSGTDSGYLTSSPGETWKTVASVVDTKSYTKQISKQTKVFKAKAYGKTVDGYGSAGGSGVTATYNVTVPALEHYTITFNGVGTGVTGVPTPKTKYYGKTLTLPTTKPKATGYVFAGWYTEKFGGSKYGTSYTANKSATLYAHWSPIEYKITYDGNGSTSGNVTSQTKLYGTAVSIKENQYVKTGYQFIGWNTKKDGTGTTHKAGSSYTGNSNLTLYAQWKKNNFTVTYDATNCGSTRTTATITVGTSFNLRANPISGSTTYNFLGWKIDGKTYKAGASYTSKVYKDITFTADVVSISSSTVNVPIQITDLQIDRCTTNSGNAEAEGGWAYKYSFDWECGKLLTYSGTTLQSTTNKTPTTIVITDDNGYSRNFINESTSVSGSCSATIVTDLTEASTLTINAIGPSVTEDDNIISPYNSTVTVEIPYSNEDIEEIVLDNIELYRTAKKITGSFNWSAYYDGNSIHQNYNFQIYSKIGNEEEYTNSLSIPLISKNISNINEAIGFEANLENISIEEEDEIELAVRIISTTSAIGGQTYPTTHPLLLLGKADPTPTIIHINSLGNGVGVFTKVNDLTGFRVGANTFLLKNLTVNGILKTEDRISALGEIELPYGKAIYWDNGLGSFKDQLRFNTNKNFVVGYPQYNESIGNTNIYGKQVNIYTKDRVYMNTPLITNGSITLPNTPDKGLKIKDKNGVVRNALYVTSNNNIVLGYPWYRGDTNGDCYIGGKTLYLRAINEIALPNAIGIKASKHDAAGTHYRLIALSTGDNVLVGDNNSSGIYIYGIPKSTTSTTANLRVVISNSSPTGQILYVSSSSKRYKHDIQDLINLKDRTSSLDPSRLYELPIHKFKYNLDYLSLTDPRSNKDIPGFIAEEVGEVYPIAMDRDENGQPEDWNVRYIVPPMLALIQQQKKQIDELEKRVAELEK